MAAEDAKTKDEKPKVKDDKAKYTDKDGREQVPHPGQQVSESPAQDQPPAAE